MNANKRNKAIKTYIKSAPESSSSELDAILNITTDSSDDEPIQLNVSLPAMPTTPAPKRHHSSSKSDESSSSKRNGDNISHRMEFIRDLLGNNQLQPLIDMDACDTDNFICTENFIGHTHEHGPNEECNDIRCTVNKKFLDVTNVFKTLGVTLNYIKSGSTGHTFKGKSKNDENVVFGVKVVAYPIRDKYGNINNASRPENAELRMIKLLSYFVVNRHTPHIVLPIASFNTSIKPFINIPKEIIDINNKKNKRYREFVEKYQNEQLHNYVSVLISEWADGGDLLDYIRSNYEKMDLPTWKVIFFQVLSVLAVIQKRYPDFRHNDLKANNVLVQKVKMATPNNKYKYTINDCDFIVPDVGIQVKLWDFDFACIPGLIDNSKVSAEWTKEINVKPKMNQYYDMHYFFNTLIKPEFFQQFYQGDIVHSDVKEFVHRVVPDPYRSGSKYVTEKGRILINKEITTPFKVLTNDPFFAEYRLFRVRTLNRK
jgi:hypothetical protein